MWQRAVDCEFLNKMTHASCIRTLFSLVVKNVSCEWKCCITTNADEGESVDGNKIHSFVEYGAVTKNQYTQTSDTC